jgi:hypothetical protein
MATIRGNATARASSRQPKANRRRERAFMGDGEAVKEA